MTNPGQAGLVFLFHWRASEARDLAAALRDEGWEVEVEAEDGARGGARVVDRRPDAVVIYLRRLPSHGRQVAVALRSWTATRDLPIVFVDGAPSKVTAVRAKVPDATFTTSDRLPEVLRDLTPGI